MSLISCKNCNTLSVVFNHKHMDFRCMTCGTPWTPPDWNFIFPSGPTVKVRVPKEISVSGYGWIVDELAPFTPDQFRLLDQEILYRKLVSLDLNAGEI